MNPYIYVYEATKNGESLLSLCCGIGLELQNLATQNVTAVDIAPQYLEKVHERCPQAKLVEIDALEYASKQLDNSIDVVSLVDGLEHLTKWRGKKLLKEMKRVAKKQVLVFFPQGDVPDGYLRNEPHDAWGISGADEHQTHKSGWTEDELKHLGYTLVASARSISQHDEPYSALLFTYKKESPDVLDNNAD